MNQESKFTSTSLIAILTLIIAIIAAIPGFLSLNSDHAEIYYSVKVSHISIPSSLDSKKALSTLRTNGIPGTTVELSIINQGNSAADIVKLSIDTPEPIMAAWSAPLYSSNPIWVNLSNISDVVNATTFKSEAKDLSITMPLRYYVGYQYSPSKEPNIKIFYAGKPAILVDEISEVSSWSEWHVFELPIKILGGGIVLTLLWIFVLTLYRDPQFRDKFIRELLVATRI